MTLFATCPGYYTKHSHAVFPDLKLWGNVEQPFIAMTHKSTLTKSGNTCYGPIHCSNKTFFTILHCANKWRMLYPIHRITLQYLKHITVFKWKYFCELNYHDQKIRRTPTHDIQKHWIAVSILLGLTSSVFRDRTSDHRLQSWNSTPVPKSI